MSITIGRLRIQFKGENIDFRIKRCTIFLVNQVFEFKPCLAISLKIATQSGQEFSLKNGLLKMTAVFSSVRFATATMTTVTISTVKPPMRPGE